MGSFLFGINAALFWDICFLYSNDYLAVRFFSSLKSQLMFNFGITVLRLTSLDLCDSLVDWCREFLKSLVRESRLSDNIVLNTLLTALDWIESMLSCASMHSSMESIFNEHIGRETLFAVFGWEGECSANSWGTPTGSMLTCCVFTLTVSGLYSLNCYSGKRGDIMLPAGVQPSLMVLYR
jgi:hypothetical protein